jgi:hypothetical protein
MADKKLSQSPIKIRLVEITMGAKIPRTDIGFAIGSVGYLQFQMNDLTVVYGTGNVLKGKAGTLGVSGIATDWLTVDHATDVQPRLKRLAGLTCDIDLTGTVVGTFGKLDIKITLYDESGSQLMSLVETIDQPAAGIQVGDAKIRGKLVFMSSSDASDRVPTIRASP